MYHQQVEQSLLSNLLMADSDWASNLAETEATQGVEQFSLSDENEAGIDEEETEGIHEEETEGNGNDDVGGSDVTDDTALNCLEDICKINLKDIRAADIMRYHFPDVGVAFMFYNWYASIHGFAARKSKVMRNIDGELTQQTFVCYRQGHRDEKNKGNTSGRREPKPHTRCGCEAKCQVHIELTSGRWYIKYFYEAHNHTLLDEKFMGMLPAHRKMKDYDKWRMKTMKKVGIKTSHIFGLFASQAGGYRSVGFRKRDMYNEQERQRTTEFSDAKAALDYLEGMRCSDNKMYWRHMVDDEGRLQQVFWCDGGGQRDYSVFGDVLAFDATYKKNKYLCPLVVFSGVNHHNQSIVFAAAVVTNETEETYVWLLEQLLAVMGGKSPISVITDGDKAMRKAIRRVFPDAHHRLCAWHLIRNATTNVGNPRFVSKFKQCMLGDIELREFKRKWENMVTEFGLQNNSWVAEMYEKRHTWATAHIRGNFFAGFRTTSRCEGLHSQFGKYVNYQNNLLEFLQQFFRCLNYMRYCEVEADFASIHGEPVLQTKLHPLEKAAANVYTREVFRLFRPVLDMACTCKVVDSMQTGSYYNYTVCKYGRESLEWQVTFCPSSLQFKCSCERMESLGLPCEHLISVLVWMDIVILPECLVLSRWTKNAKDSISESGNDKSSFSCEPTLISQYVSIVERCKRMATAAVECGKPRLLRSTIHLIDAQTKLLEQSCKGGGHSTARSVQDIIEESVRNPARVRTKGRGAASSSRRTKGKRAVKKPQTCGVCRAEGHNRLSCPLLSQIDNTTVEAHTQVESNAMEDDTEFAYDELYDANVDMNVA